MSRTIIARGAALAAATMLALTACGGTDEAEVPDDGAAGLLHREMAAVQDGILALAARGQSSLHSEAAADGRAAVAADLVWAFTRADRHLCASTPHPKIRSSTTGSHN